MRILIEASGGLTSGYLIEAIRSSGNECVASDINENCFARYIANDFIQMPPVTKKGYWEDISTILKSNKIDLVIPSLDETLLDWAEKKDLLRKDSVEVIISKKETVDIFQDKWKTYSFFKEKNIPTPRTSLKQEYPLIKPKRGRGGKGVEIINKSVSMEGKISQEIAKGDEYTIDVFCDVHSKPIYIVPRKRINVREGKSIEGVVEKNDLIESWVNTICKNIDFLGPINIQCFLEREKILFTEVNPRLGGGTALGFAATENWIELIESNLLKKKTINPVPIKYGMKMKRFYAEVFV